MKTHVKLFQHWGAEKIRQGIKCSTIRPLPKRAQDWPKIGDVLDAREWSGKPYRSKQVKIGRFTVSRVRKMRIETVLTFSSVWYFTNLAREEGFDSLDAMWQWFEREHGLPFEGLYIRFENWRGTATPSLTP